MNIFKIFKRKKISEPLKNDSANFTPIPEANKKIYGEDYFNCHYCGKEIIIEPLKIFPTNVRSCDGNYFFPGKGYLCPHCLKTCIIG